ncbi:MAG: GNAT family N-acetyltransferase [Dehalococcoidia bacterium]|jgi:ribosomal protein S18 acetylase RimI-like enzyme|nr:GNAT family N-acetyltransferase [Dehalococcoidia bacterium]
MEPLDNPFWTALTAQPQFATGDQHARRYRPDVDTIAALPDEPDARSWAALATLVEEPQGINLLRLSYDIPEDWTVHGRRDIVQMVCESAPAHPEGFIFEELTPDDRPEMLKLVEATRPGPYAINTPDLGDYIGIRENGRILAMAGARIRTPGFTEVSAVCTDPTAQGRGLGAAISAELTARIFDRGEQAFLHAAAANPGPQRIYQRLGYRVVRTLEHAVLSPPA